MSGGTTTAATLPRTVRLSWFDTVKGMSILWIVVFHFFMTYDASRHPWPLTLASFPAFMNGCAPQTLPQTVACVVDGLLAALFERGAQAVAVFIVLSGFGLTYGMSKRGGPGGGWGAWYRRRVLRLYPMYWLAHLLCLVSPLILLKDPIDGRFIWSLVGNRIYPADTMFLYLVPAWWFFGLLIQLYVVFPLLFRVLKRVGPVPFLSLSVLFTVAARYLLQEVIRADSNYVQGAFFGSRLWEFSTGMVVGWYYGNRPQAVEDRLFSFPLLILGAVLYVLGVYSYQPVFTYVFTDGLIGGGLFIIMAQMARWVERWSPPRRLLGVVGAYSYGLYLLHQPYVLYFGERLRDVGMFGFVAVGTAIVAVITLGSSLLERAVNTLTATVLS